MTIQEVYDQTYSRISKICFGVQPDERFIALAAMKEYAHLMCEKQKIICADNAEADWDYEGRIYSDDESGYCGISCYVLNQSIIQCKNATEI